MPLTDKLLNLVRFTKTQNQGFAALLSYRSSLKSKTLPREDEQSPELNQTLMFSSLPVENHNSAVENFEITSGKSVENLWKTGIVIPRAHDQQKSAFPDIS